MPFDLTDPRAIQANPILAKALIKSVPAFELNKMTAVCVPDEDSFLEEKPIVAGILESSNAALQLVLAANVRFKLWGGTKEEEIVPLLDKGSQFRAALFSNVRIDWYHGGFGGRNKLLDAAIKTIVDHDDANEDDRSLASVLLRNPRFHRGKLADMIRGAEEFSSLSVKRRAFVAYESLGVEEIRSRNYPGKDSPDNNELEFSSPAAAFPCLLRSIVEVEPDTLPPFARSFVWKVASVDLDIDPADWIEKNADSVNAGSADNFTQRYQQRRVQALQSFLDFVRRSTRGLANYWNAQEGDGKNPAPDDYVPALFVIVVGSILQRFWRTSANFSVEALIGDESPVVRAAAYNAIFRMIPVEAEQAPLLQKLFASDTNDSFEKWLGIVYTEGFALQCLSEGAGRVLSAAMQNSKHIDRLSALIDELPKYLFPISFVDDDAELAARVSRHNSKCDSTTVNRLLGAEKNRAKQSTSGAQSYARDSSKGKSVFDRLRGK